MNVGDWTRVASPNGQGRVQFNLQQSPYPVVSVETLLDGVRAGYVTGADLRNIAGTYFKLPSVAGSYKLTVIARSAASCEDGALRPMTVIVQ